MHIALFGGWYQNIQTEPYVYIYDLCDTHGIINLTTTVQLYAWRSIPLLGLDYNRILTECSSCNSVILIEIYLKQVLQALI